MSTLIQITPASGITVGTTAVTSGTVGRVFFQGTGDVVQQDPALFWDNTNKRLGVGASPATTVRLDVRAQGALSTDVALRVRNSADTLNFAEFNGDGQFSLRKSTNEGIFMGGTGGFLSMGTNFSSLLFPLGAASTEVTFNTSSQGLRVNSSTGRFYVNNTTYNGSLWMVRTVVGIGGLLSTNDLSSVSNSRGLTLLNGTPPTTNFEDRHWYYSADIVAGNAAPHFRTENGNIIKLYQQSSAGITTVADLVTILQNTGLLS
jgi:hypothetical protein